MRKLDTAGTLRKGRRWHYCLDELCQWLATLPRPLGLMAVDDSRARMVVDACRLVGLRVPYDVAIVGVDNNRMACEGARPTLSTVALNAAEVGYRAAALLDQLMADCPRPPQPLLVPAIDIVARESTDMVAIDDPELNTAVCYIREHLDQPLSVKVLLQAVSVSRRWLEYRFRERFGLSPYEYLCRTRVERAKQLLRESNKLSSRQIAAACGFRSTRALRLAFQRVLGITPREYRLRQRHGV